MAKELAILFLKRNALHVDQGKTFVQLFTRFSLTLSYIVATSSEVMCSTKYSETLLLSGNIGFNKSIGYEHADSFKYNVYKHITRMAHIICNSQLSRGTTNQNYLWTMTQCHTLWSQLTTLSFWPRYYDHFGPLPLNCQ